ncbi:3-dehydroquinate synthase [Hyphococcus flavus]|uniref:3-dehydroquinate synthase n=1 Tax=Hyphococcus flavus TaxID=1866326 RepID=A0AAE9ZIP7_9PROT|nr:3-dehydroquinate synthase [Hyphococcus flavus]WDI31731.1 3-dehydroquinate synthase [Hyphococcus flavus]
MTMQSVHVSLSERSYDILISEGLLEHAGAVLNPFLNRRYVAIVTDENVHSAQGDRLIAGLKAESVGFDFITLKPGEATKSFGQLEELTSQLLDLGIERNDLVLAFGGGVIGDLTGFACSILRRGCRFAQIPTTLLAQVDSAVGGKTAVNVKQGKNLVGAFHQPALVLCDVAALNTLSERELRAGYAEVVKYGLIADAPFFKWLEANGPALLNGDIATRTQAVKRSCELKAAIVEEDEKEDGARALLNLGHTFGHAFEAAFGYSGKFLHGEAVALGTVFAFEYSVRLGRCAPNDAERVKRHLKLSGLPIGIDNLPGPVSADQLISFMMQDKKVQQGALTLILPDGIGAAKVVKDADYDDVKQFLINKIGA